jgi:hypothetical protein
MNQTVITTLLETITPQTAAMYLQKNAAGRSLKPAAVKMYAELISQGKWKPNGESIKFALSGDLIDGQHRLAACVKSGLPFTTYVIRGLSPSVFDTLDTGKVRSTIDMLEIMKVENASYVGKALRLLFYWERGDWNHNAPKSDVIATFRKHPCITQSAKTIQQFTRKHGRVFGASAAVMGHYLFSKVDPVKADAFFQSLYDGIGLDQDSPIYGLRERVFRMKTASTSIREVPQVVLMIKAWNYYYTGTKGQLRYSKNDEFPLIAGLATSTLSAEAEVA